MKNRVMLVALLFSMVFLRPLAFAVSFPESAENRQQFLSEVMIFRKQSCDLAFKYDNMGATTADSAYAKDKYKKCLYDLISESVHSLYKHEDIEKIKFNEAIKALDKALVDMVFLIGGSRLICTESDSCDYAGGSMWSHLPYDEVNGFYNKILEYIYSVNLNNDSKYDLMMNQFKKHENVNE